MSYGGPYRGKRERDFGHVLPPFPCLLPLFFVFHAHQGLVELFYTLLHTSQAFCSFELFFQIPDSLVRALLASAPVARPPLARRCGLGICLGTAQRGTSRISSLGTSITLPLSLLSPALLLTLKMFLLLFVRIEIEPIVSLPCNCFFSLVS